MRSFVISENDAGQRLDKFILKAVPLLPKTLLYKYIRLKRIKRNGKRCDQGDKLTAGDCIELYLNDEFFIEDTQQEAFLRASGQIDIVYEDEHILLVDKAPGLLVHEDEGEKTDTLINRILHYLYDKGEYDPRKEQSFVPALCNRIDRNTGGIVIAAKDAKTLRVMNQFIKERELRKLYLCLVHGTPKKKSETMVAYHTKDSQTNTVTLRPTMTPGSKTAITKYKVLKSGERFSLVEVELKTGRTHQIRAHMAYIGHPLVGDTKYGRNKDNKDTGFRYQALYSYKLIFTLDGDAEHLEYLRHKEFEVKEVWFTKTPL